MSTAHRPTYNPAKGGANQGGYHRWSASSLVSSLQLPAHTKLKLRDQSKIQKTEVSREDMKRELLEREKKVKGVIGQNEVSEEEQKEEKNEQLLQITYRGEDDLLGKKDDSTKVETELNSIPDKHDDSDDELASDSDKDENEGDNNSDDDDDDDDEEEEELLKELEKIKKEREMERLKKEEDERAAKEQEETQQILEGNPLMQASSSTVLDSSSLKRRWTDDVVFKNQSKDEPKAKKRFINDTVRSDFHHKFMQKYIH